MFYTKETFIPQKQFSLKSFASLSISISSLS